MNENSVHVHTHRQQLCNSIIHINFVTYYMYHYINSINRHVQCTFVTVHVHVQLPSVTKTHP